MEDFTVNIGNTGVRFIAHEKEILEYIKYEFVGFENRGCKTELQIEFLRCECNDMTGQVLSHGKNLFKDDAHIYFCINARFRHTWIKLDKKFTHMYVYINYYNHNLKEKFMQFIAPTFLIRWQNQLVDFIHGPFLGVLQAILIRKGSLLLHSGALQRKNRGIAVAGGAQSGKSTIVDYLSYSGFAKFLGEDFCIIGSDGIIQGWKKRRRFYLNQLKNKKINYAKGIRERLNIVLCQLYRLLGSEGGIRLLAIQEIYDEEQYLSSCQFTDIIFLQSIKEGQAYFERVTPQQMAALCYEMMVSEMSNVTGFLTIMKANEILHEVWAEMKEVLDKLFNGKQCSVLYLPHYEESDFVEKFIKEKLLEILSAPKYD